MKVLCLLLMTAASLLLPLCEACFFIEQPTSVKAVVGEPISISCNVNASSGTFDHWLFKPAGSNSYSALETENTTTLQRASFAPEDAGDYRCQLSVQEPDGIVLSQPATVSYFSGPIVEHPKDFDSYVLINDSSNFMMRPVIAFECTYDPESCIRPLITWQECHSNGSYTDLLETTDPVNDGAQSDIVKHVLFQSGHTGYFQILDRNNEAAYDGTSYRCKASSTLPGDSAEIFSDCAAVTFHSADVSIPEDLPIFRTIPQTTITLTDENSVGVLACSIQRNDDNSPLVVTREGNIVITGLIALGLPFFGYTYIPQTNLQINLTDLDNPSAFTSETYVCSLDGTGISHSATFIRADPTVFMDTEEVVQDVLGEDEVGSISFNTIINSSELRVLKDGVQLALDGTDIPEVQYSTSMESGITTHTLTIPTVTEEYEGVYQFEVEDKTGRDVEYHLVTMKIKARSTTDASQTVVAKVTQDLSLLCSATGNTDDSQIDFTWKRDNVTLETSFEAASNGAASHTYTLVDVRETHSGDYVCSPTNSYGGYNSSQFTVQVEKYDRPTVLEVEIEDDDEFEIEVTWTPVDLMTAKYPGAHVDKYIVVLTVITAADEIEMEQEVSGSLTSTNFSINSAAFSYSAKVKAVTDDGYDITDFSAEVKALATTPTVPPATVSMGLQGWAIFLIIFFILLLVLGGLVFLCLLFFILSRKKEKGQYNAEKQESDMARQKAREADGGSETSV